jgi:quercetin dioxygenase-like cupin family protein
MPSSQLWRLDYRLFQCGKERGSYPPRWHSRPRAAFSRFYRTRLPIYRDAKCRLLIERPPGGGSPPHRHPGHHTFGYVIEGAYEFAIDGQPPRLLKAGETFYEPPTAIHSTSRNPSTDQSLKMIVFMVADQKNPTTVRD